MVIDTSALLAILLQEAEAERIARVIAGSSLRLVSAATIVEAGIVLELRYGSEGARNLDLLCHTLNLGISPVTAKQANLARKAYRQFGKGVHPAGLNFGDCFSYALAKAEGLPLLFKGQDFEKTDLAFVIYWGE
jgi:ribonuclease VapC